MHFVSSAQANWSSEHGGSELKERVDGSANLLEEFMVSLYCSTASLPSLKVGCRTCVYLKGCRVGELSYLFAWVCEMLLLISSTWWSPVRSFSCTSFRWMLKMLAITRNCSTPMLWLLIGAHILDLLRMLREWQNADSLISFPKRRHCQYVLKRTFDKLFRFLVDVHTWYSCNQDQRQESKTLATDTRLHRPIQCDWDRRQGLGGMKSLEQMF